MTLKPLLVFATLLFSSAASAQVLIPGEPAPPRITDAPVSASQLTRGGNLVLPAGSGQAGTGPALETRSGQFGLPFSTSWGLGEDIELGGSFKMLLAPFNVQTALVSDFSAYTRYRAIPEKLAVEVRLKVPYGLTNFQGVLVTAEAPYTSKISEDFRIFLVNNMEMNVAGGFQFNVNTSSTLMYLITDKIYAQQLTGLGLAASGAGVFLPGRDVPVMLGAGGGYLLGENTGAGLALNLGLASPQGLGGGAVQSTGIIATYTKGL